MHGLINRSLQCYLRDTFGPPLWLAAARQAGLAPEGFESMQFYEDRITFEVLDAAAAALDRPRSILLEEFGAYLVSHPHLQPLRRLLRFGGVDFVDFLHSLDDLPDRARLAVPELELPALDLAEEGDGRFTIRIGGRPDGFGHVLAGILRAMADDYGTLAMIGGSAAGDRLSIRLLDTGFAPARRPEAGRLARGLG